MQPLAKHEVIGRRLTEVIIAKPDKPVSMADQSCSRGYVRLDNDIVIDLESSGSPRTCDVAWNKEFERDDEHEKSFKPAIGQKIVELLSSDEFAGICVVLESGCVIAVVPGQFWVAPFLHKREDFPFSTAKAIWQS